MNEVHTLLDTVTRIMGEGRCGAKHCFGPATVSMDATVVDTATNKSLPAATKIPLCEQHANMLDVLSHHLDDSELMHMVFDLIDWDR